MLIELIVAHRENTRQNQEYDAYKENTFFIKFHDVYLPKDYRDSMAIAV